MKGVLDGEGGILAAEEQVGRLLLLLGLVELGRGHFAPRELHGGVHVLFDLLIFGLGVFQSQCVVGPNQVMAVQA